MLPDTKHSMRSILISGNVVLMRDKLVEILKNFIAINTLKDLDMNGTGK